MINTYMRQMLWDFKESITALIALILFIITLIVKSYNDSKKEFDVSEMAHSELNDDK